MFSITWVESTVKEDRTSAEHLMDYDHKKERPSGDPARWADAYGLSSI